MSIVVSRTWLMVPCFSLNPPFQSEFRGVNSDFFVLRFVSTWPRALSEAFAHGSLNAHGECRTLSLNRAVIHVILAWRGTQISLLELGPGAKGKLGSISANSLLVVVVSTRSYDILWKRLASCIFAHHERRAFRFHSLMVAVVVGTGPRPIVLSRTFAPSSE